MPHIPLHDLRRVADALKTLRGGQIADAVMRSDLRQLRIELQDGRLAVIGLDVDGEGRPRLELDLIRQPEQPAPQLEVRFESA
jgi:hypothetical protein